MPDPDARRAIFAAQLKGRPCDASIDANDLAARTEGYSAARIKEAVDGAALLVLKAVAASDPRRTITQGDLVAAIEAQRGKDRPTVGAWTWDQVILQETTKRELQELQRLIESPERARHVGIMVPAGALLYGPPGTGKTTISRDLAAQRKASFYPVQSSDIVSKWLGESARNVAKLFDRSLVTDSDGVIRRLEEEIKGGSGAEGSARCQEAGVQALVRDETATAVAARDLAAAMAPKNRGRRASVV